MNAVVDPAPPLSLEEVIREYTPLVRGILYNKGVSNVDDASQEVLTRFMENDLLEIYDPGFSVVHEGVLYGAKFRSFLTAYVQRSALGIRDKEARLRAREVKSLDAASSPDAGAAESSLKDQLVADQAEFLADLEADELVIRLREWLAFVPVRGKRDISLLFELILVQLAENPALPKPDRSRLARDMGVSVSAVGTMLTEMRQEMSQCLAS